MSYRPHFDVLPFNAQERVENPKGSYVKFLPIDTDAIKQSWESLGVPVRITQQTIENNHIITLWLQGDSNQDELLCAKLIRGSETTLYISAYPQEIAISLILDFRKHVDDVFELFITISEPGVIVPLTEKTTRRDIELLYDKFSE